MRLPVLSPAAYRRVTLVALVALAFIIVSGAAVRLTGSGLGCPDWPTCADDRVVAPLEYHAMVEFVNRTITGLVSVAVILAVLGSLRRQPRRRDLTWLSLGLVAGVIGQIVLGGLTVLFELKPGFVMAHFLLSMVILANAVVLHDRAGRPDDDAAGAAGLGGRPRPAPARLAGGGRRRAGPLPGHGRDLVRPPRRRRGRRAAAVRPARRGPLPRGERDPVPRPHPGHPVAAARGPARRRRVLRRGEVVLAVSVAQAAVGYIQYFNGVPALLVGFHMAGAAAVWVATLRFRLAFAGPARRRPSAVPGPARAGDRADRAA